MTRNLVFHWLLFVYQTENRGDPLKVVNNENVNIWKNANHLHKKVKLSKLRTEKCPKDISLLNQIHSVFQNIKFIEKLARKMRLIHHW